jgi:hypothetical protein
LRAANMLNQRPEWVAEQRQMLEPIYGGLSSDFVFPITAIRRFAREQNLSVTPRPIENGVLWFNRPRDQTPTP